eukprot:COSAG05_NODE_276_length_12393_cov_1737.505694_12_plen_73_part_00
MSTAVAPKQAAHCAAARHSPSSIPSRQRGSAAAAAFACSAAAFACSALACSEGSDRGTLSMIDGGRKRKNLK